MKREAVMCDANDYEVPCHQLGTAQCSLCTRDLCRNHQAFIAITFYSSSSSVTTPTHNGQITTLDLTPKHELLHAISVCTQCQKSVKDISRELSDMLQAALAAKALVK